MCPLHDDNPYHPLGAETCLSCGFGEARDLHTPLSFPAALGKPPTFYWPQGITKCFLYWTSLIFACQASSPLLIIIIWFFLWESIFSFSQTMSVYQIAQLNQKLKSVVCWVSKSQLEVLWKLLGKRISFLWDWCIERTFWGHLMDTRADIGGNLNWETERKREDEKNWWHHLSPWMRMCLKLTCPWNFHLCKIIDTCYFD